MVDVKLTPCPFCGGEAIVDDVSNFLGQTRWTPACQTEDCVMWNANYATQREAIAAWNTRLQPSGDGGAMTQALFKVVAYDQLLRAIGGMWQRDILFAGDMPDVDAVYDDMVATAISALKSTSPSPAKADDPTLTENVTVARPKGQG